MLTIEEVQDILDTLADDIPPEIFDGLNGGVVLLPDTKLHPKNIRGDLYILGEYHNEPRGLGRYINIYYGSFSTVHGHDSYDVQVQKLREVLHHELTHHLEGLAGDKSLEIQDARDYENYERRHRKRHTNKEKE